LAAQDASKTTVAFGCPSGTDPSECGFGTGIVTATFGPSTLVVTDIDAGLTATLNCAVEGVTAATCTQTYIGPADFLGEATATAETTVTNTAITTIVTTTTLGPSDM
jgi:hypothetical protein